MANDILKGIKIVELGTYVAVPYCTRILADMGAEVIKVEPPKGEDYRVRMGRNFQLPFEAKNDWCFAPYNCNKKSFCIDLKKEGSVDTLKDLINSSDVFISNTREESLKKMGLGFEELVAQNPKLICGSISGFGTKGPKKDNRGFDLSSFWSGANMINEWNFKGNKAFKPFYGFGDAITGCQLALGIMSALFVRERTGKGDIVRTSLYATGLWTNVCGLLRIQAGHKFPKDFNQPIVPMDNLYETKDGYYITIGESNWGDNYMKYLEVFDALDKVGDPDWCTIEGYCSNIPEKVKFFEKAIKSKTKDEIYNYLTPRGTVVTVLKSTDEILDDPQAWENEMLRKMKCQGGDELIIPNIPLRFNNHGLIDEIEPAHQLGEDSDEVLKDIGYSGEKISELKANKNVVAYKE